MSGAITAACLHGIVVKHVESMRDGFEEMRQDTLWTEEMPVYRGRVEACKEILRFLETVKDMVTERPVVQAEPLSKGVCKHCGKVNGCPICSVHPADE